MTVVVSQRRFDQVTLGLLRPRILNEKSYCSLFCKWQPCLPILIGNVWNCALCECKLRRIRTWVCDSVVSPTQKAAPGHRAGHVTENCRNIFLTVTLRWKRVSIRCEKTLRLWLLQRVFPATAAFRHHPSPSIICESLRPDTSREPKRVLAIPTVFEVSITEADLAVSCRVEPDPIARWGDGNYVFHITASTKYSLVPQGQIQCQNDLASQIRVVLFRVTQVLYSADQTDLLRHFHSCCCSTNWPH